MAVAKDLLHRRATLIESVLGDDLGASCEGLERTHNGSVAREIPKPVVEGGNGGPTPFRRARLVPSQERSGLFR